jgi:hypothetical protein
MKRIEVRIPIKDLMNFSSPKEYFAFVEKKLQNAGIPVQGEIVLEGKLFKFDDPLDFGTSIWIWESSDS